MRRKIVAEAYGEVVGFVSVLGRCRSAAPDDAAVRAVPRALGSEWSAAKRRSVRAGMIARGWGAIR
jgi:hypothetical protein